MKKPIRYIHYAIILCVIKGFALVSWAEPFELGSVRLFSEVDQQITLSRVSWFSVSDNVGGLLAEGLEQALRDKIEEQGRWESRPIGEKVFATGKSPREIQELGRKLAVDGFFHLRALETSQGLNLIFELYLSHDGLPLLRVEKENLVVESSAAIHQEFAKVFSQLVAKIPYQGLVLSREGNEVTINLGQRDGLKEGQILSMVQFIELIRHPHFHFLVESHKQPLGQIKLVQVESALSFAEIIAEQSPGVITKNAKVTGLRPVVYYSGSPSRRKSLTGLSTLEIEEWVPAPLPQFGALGFHLGTSDFTYNMDFQNISNLSGRSTLSPTVRLEAEIWLTPKWFGRVDYHHTLASLDNPKSGASPQTLQISRSRTSFLLGYNFLVNNNFWGPRFRLALGGLSSQVRLDRSTPNSLAATNQSGILTHFGIQVPFHDNQNWRFNAHFHLLFRTRFSESDSLYGDDPDNSYAEFALSLERKVSENFYAALSLESQLYKTDFGASLSAEGAKGLSQQSTVLQLGARYFF